MIGFVVMAVLWASAPEIESSAVSAAPVDASASDALAIEAPASDAPERRDEAPGAPAAVAAPAEGEPAPAGAASDAPARPESTAEPEAGAKAQHAPAQTTAPPPATTAPVAPVATASTSPAMQRRWYGWQTALVDAAGWALIVEAPHNLKTLGAIVLLTGSPVIHALHGSGPKTLVSLLLRPGLAMTGGMIGLVLAGSHGSSADHVTEHDEGDEGAAIGAFFVGGLIGVAVAEVVDIFVLGVEARRTTAPAAGTAWQPFVAPRDGGALAGVAASF